MPLFFCMSLPAFAYDVDSRFGVFLVWNFSVGVLIFLAVLCFKIGDMTIGCHIVEETSSVICI